MSHIYETPVREDPSPKIDKRHSYMQILLPLRETPGEWFKISERGTESAAYQAAYNLRKGKYHIPEGDWKFRHDGTALYAMFVTTT